MTRVPLFVLALSWCSALAGASVLLPQQPVVGVVALALVPVCLATVLIIRPPLVALAVAVAMLGVGRAELPAADPHIAARAMALTGQFAVVQGRVADDPRPGGGGAEVLVEPQLVEVGGHVAPAIGNLMVRWRGPSQVEFGDEVQASGRLVRPADLPTFDRRAYLAQRQVFAELQATTLDVLSSAPGTANPAGWLRANYISAVNAALPPPHSAVLLGIVLGVRQGIPPELEQALIATGLIHLLVLSGLKVAVFARLVQGALRPVLGRLATGPALVLIGLYAVAGGATPAAVRAAAMGAMAILASHLGRPTHVWTSLGATAAAMLGWHPELAWDVGFQLSFAGTAAIILLTPGIERRLRFLPQPVREPFAVTCAAQVGTLPMTASTFHVVSLVAPLANALTLPLLPAVITTGFLVGLTSPLPGVAGIIALPLSGVLAYIEHVAGWMARAPASAINLPAFPGWLGLAYYAGVGPATLALHSTRRTRRAALVASVAAPLMIAVAAMALWANSPPQVSILAVGDGQAVLLRGPHGTILIDGGPSPARLADGLGTQLPPWQSRLDALVITAPTLGHVGGLAGFNRAAGLVLIPDADLGGSAWRTAAYEELARGAAVQKLGAGASLIVGGFLLQALSPEQGAPGDVVGAADLALRIVAPDGKSFCDMSDLDLDAQSIAAVRLTRPCDIVLLPYGGRSLLSPDLQQAAVSASTQLIASRGAGRLASGFPSSVLRTDQEGTITMPL